MPGYIPSEAIERLLAGSYEETINNLGEAVSEQWEQFGASSPNDVSIVATFPRNVIISTNDGKFFKAGYKRNDGSIAVTRVESVSVPVLKTREDQKKFLSEAASDAVSSFLAGDYDSARSQVRELVHAGALLKDQNPLEEAKETLEELFSPERPWRKIYTETSKTIHRVLWGASGATFRYAPKPKYQDIYSENTDVAEGFHQSISIDLSLMTEKLRTLWGWIESSWGKYDSKHGMFKGIAISDVAENFEQFAVDYIDELRIVCQLAESAASDDNPEHAAAMALVHDVIATNYASLEVGARLVQRVATELAEVR